MITKYGDRDTDCGINISKVKESDHGLWECSGEVVDEVWNPTFQNIIYLRVLLDSVSCYFHFNGIASIYITRSGILGIRATNIANAKQMLQEVAG